MKKLFKFLLKTLLWLLAILLVVVVVGYLTAGIWIKSVVSSFVPKVTHTTASLESADISLFSGRLALKGLKIGSPAGFKDPYVFELGEVSVQFQPKTIFSNKIIVDQVLIKGTKITAEYNQKAQMNLMVLNDNVQSSLNQGNAGQAVQNQKAAKTDAKSGKAVVIKDLKIVDTSVRFSVMGHGQTFNLPDIQQKNIGEKKKTTFAEGIRLISETLTVESMQAMAKAGQNAVKDALKVIESHTTDSESVKKLKGILSEVNFF